MKDYALCLGNILKDFIINDIYIYIYIYINRNKRSCKIFFLLILILLMLTTFETFINI